MTLRRYRLTITVVTAVQRDMASTGLAACFLAVLLIHMVSSFEYKEVQLNPTPPPPPPPKTASLNKWLDVIVYNVVNNASTLGIEPLALPNVSSPLTSQWYFPYDHLTLQEGVLKNLQTIRRTGNSTVTYVNNTIEIKVEAAFTNLEVEYVFDAKSSYSWFSLGGLLQGEIGEMQIFADLTVDADTLAVKAKEIIFPGTKKINFCIKSTILATWTVNLILEVVELFSDLIIDQVQTAVTDALNEFFENRIPHTITQQAWISPANTFSVRIL